MGTDTYVIEITKDLGKLSQKVLVELHNSFILKV